jgi:hypothetical protein
MAREFAKVRLSIWNDDDFRALPPHEQHLYFVLMTSVSLSYCGVTDWRPSRIAPLAGGWTPEQVVFTAAGLVDKLYLLVDDATEEVLVRSFIRNDEILKQPKMAVAMVKAHAAVSSATLRGVVVHELNRLREDDPTLNGWEVDAVTNLLPKASVDPSVYPLGKGSDWTSVKGPVSPIGWGNPMPPVKGSGYPPPTTETATATLNQQHSDSLRSSGAVAPSDINAGTIVGAWVDAFTAPQGRQRPSESMRKQAGKQARDLIEGGAKPELVLEAAKLAGAKGYPTLDREYAPLVTASTRNGRPANLKDWVEQ